MKKYPKKFREYIGGMCDYLRIQTYNGENDLTVGYEYEPDADNPDIVASIDIDTVYLTIYVTIYPRIYEYYKDKKYHRIGELLCHEFCHTFIDPLYDIAINAVTNTSKKFLEDIKERQTQRITNALMNHLPKFYKIDKK